MMDGMDNARASRTAVFVCQGRAVGDGRFAIGSFEDPVAAQLLRPDELVAVERARAVVPPADWRERLETESLRACAEVVVPRTMLLMNQVLLVGRNTTRSAEPSPSRSSGMATSPAMPQVAVNWSITYQLPLALPNTATSVRPSPL